MSEQVSLAILFLITMVVKDYLDRRRIRESVVKSDERAAVIKKDLNARGDALESKIEVIHKATNSMKDELVAEVKKSSFAAGEKSEGEKQRGEV